MNLYRSPLLANADGTVFDRTRRRELPLGIVDRFVEDVGLRFLAHRFGHSHDGGGAGGAVDEDDVLAAIRREADELHTRLSHEHGLFVVEVMGSTGSGKTAILERLIQNAPDDERIGVIVGDVAGDDDARRFRELGVEVANVNTGKECHLDPTLVEDALAELDLEELTTLFVENVGNMVCPADFPLGAEARILVVSTTEGDDVVRKHPLLFQAADAAVINKIDIADAVGADVDTMCNDVAETAPDLPVFAVSVRENVGIDDFESFLDEVRSHHHDHVHDGEHDHLEHAHGHDDKGHGHGHEEHGHLEHAHGHEGHQHEHHHHGHEAHQHEHHHDDHEPAVLIDRPTKVASDDSSGESR
ncbi:MAG: hydrogenase nickel incorporation protein HypB [Halodesulfurarchaeum sp.]